MKSTVTLEMNFENEVVIRRRRNFEKECQFCGKHTLEVERLVVGGNSSICNECIELSYNLLIDEGINLKNK